MSTLMDQLLDKQRLADCARHDQETIDGEVFTESWPLPPVRDFRSIFAECQQSAQNIMRGLE